MSRELNYLNDMLGASSAYAYNVTPTHLNRYPAHVQFTRLAHDMGMYREAIREMELAYNPMRVKFIRMAIDTVQNPFIVGLLGRWRELTTQRDPIIYQRKGDKIIESVDLSQAFQEQEWTKEYIGYAVDSLAWGYGLISMGDIVNDSFPNLSIIRRENIRPDGVDEKAVLTSLIYTIGGIPIESGDPMVQMFNHYIPTKSDIGVSKCGYGFLYPLAQLEIHLRHITEWNMDFLQDFAQPIKKGFTNKTGKDRKIFEDFIKYGGANAGILLDKSTGDDLMYEFASNVGAAYKSYADMEDRLKDCASQMILGHSDAMRTSPDKLGGNQKSNKDGDNVNMVQEAINAKQIYAGDFVSGVINKTLAKNLRKIGKKFGSKIIGGLLPEGYTFGLKNDTEENAVKSRTNNFRLVFSEITKNFNVAGFDLDAAQVEEITGLKVTPATPETRMYQVRDTTTTTTAIKQENE